VTPTATSPRRELGDVRVGAVGADTYIRANVDRIPNYGERHRAGETISSSFVESAVNQVISKRMVKKQQNRSRGAAAAAPPRAAGDSPTAEETTH
jgi:hypothetical protein